MKKIFTLIAICSFWISAPAQETMEKTMEKRAREMHRVIGLSDKRQWKTFVSENYSQALIDKPMRAQVESDNGKSTSSSTKASNNLDAKAAMFQQLHADFKDSKLVSIKPNGTNLEMILQNEGGFSGIFTLKFESKKPYLIDGLGIEVNAEE